MIKAPASYSQLSNRSPVNFVVNVAQAIAQSGCLIRTDVILEEARLAQQARR
jgi:hypothetical protein